MSESIIHVIPEAYYGGAVSSRVSRKEVFKAEGAPTAAASKLKITASPKKMFIAIIAVLFVIVVSGASWYFIRHARPMPPPAPPPAPELPVVIPPEQESAEPPIETPAESSQAEPVPESVVPAPSPGKDTDSDGLSDTEEVLYGGQVSVPDTDNDGFIDGHEVINLYNPSGIAPQRLEAAGHAKKYSNETAGYTVLIPALWQTTTLPENPYLTVIKDRVGKDVFEIEFIRDASSAPAIEGAVDWSTNKFGLAGFISPDKQRAYFTKNNTVYMIRYKEGQNVDEYKTTFGVLLNSFNIVNNES